jgi:hypothetical protein
MSVSGCNNPYKFVLSAGAKVEERSDEIPPWRGKNRDKQLTHIVRVMCRCYFYFISFEIRFSIWIIPGGSISASLSLPESSIILFLWSCRKDLMK